MGSATLAAERAASRERSAERDAGRIQETRARMLLDLARPGATRAELQESAASQWPKLGGREQERLVEEAERLQELRRGLSVAPDLTRLALQVPERAVPVATAEVPTEAEVPAIAPAATEPDEPQEEPVAAKPDKRARTTSHKLDAEQRRRVVDVVRQGLAAGDSVLGCTDRVARELGIELSKTTVHYYMQKERNPADPRPAGAAKPAERKKPAPAASRAEPVAQETSPPAQPPVAPAAAPAQCSAPSVQIEYGPDGMRVHAALNVRTKDTGAVAALLDVIRRLTVDV